MKEIKINVKKVIKEKKQEVTIDIGKRKSGFKFSEALMEATDDSFDAFYFTGITDSERHIKIYVFEEDYHEKEEDNKGDTEKTLELEMQENYPKRYSYIILDNGPGTSVDNVFNFGKEKTKRFPDLTALNSLNGLFHYGMSSHLNVGTKIYFYSKSAESEWWMNCLEASDLSNKVFTYTVKSKPEISIQDKQLNLGDPYFNVGTVVLVQGVRKSEVEADNITGLVKSLMKQFGITYAQYLEKGNKIYINDEEVVAIDPFLRKGLYVESGIGSTLAGNIEISLEEIFNIEDSYVKESTIKRFRHLFETDSAFLKQKISINIYHLNAAFLIPSFRSKVNKELPGCMLPSIEDSGFYIKRNHRYIGRAAKILGVDHPQLNYLRFEIAFSPIFDDFFGIQVNKNRYDIKHSLASLIIERIKEKVNYSSLTAYTKNFRSTEKPKEEPPLTTSLITRLKSKVQLAADYEVEIENNTNYAGSLGAQIELIWARQVVLELKKQKTDIQKYIINISDENNLSDKESKMAEILIRDIDILLKNASQKLAQLKGIITSRKEQLIVPAIELDKRLRGASEDRRLIKSIGDIRDNSFFGSLLEPINEVQTYGVLYMFLNLFPDVFDFKLLDYSEAKGLDCVAKIKQSSLYTSLNMKVRFENKWNSEWDELLNRTEGAYSFVELKYKLGKEENLGHSMVLVSHLICWDFYKDGFSDFNAIDGKYTLTDDKGYLIHQDGIKKIKVVCLREKVEEILQVKLYTSSEDFRNYLFTLEEQPLL